MVRRAMAGAAVATPAAYAVGSAAAGPDGGVSAALGVAVVAANFAAQGMSLAWAAGVSVTAVQAVALGGFLVRMGVILGLLFALDRTAFFSPLVFGLAVVATIVALLAYEARLVLGGLGGDLDIPPDRAATVAAARLRAREESAR